MTRAQIVRAAPWIVITSGLAYCLWLVAGIPGPVFCNGDGGVKLLLVQQALGGYFGPELRLPAEAWLTDLWAHGTYPFGPPFVFEDGGRRVQAFPVFFAWVSAPFHALFGWRGLYVVPLLAVVALWVRFHVLCRQLGVGTVARTLALAALVFASPLSLYAAMFWEHTLAAALTLFGMAELLLAVDGRTSSRRLLPAGLLLGLAGWLRPENFAFAAIVAVVATALLLWRARRADAVRLAVVVGVTLAGFCVWNLAFTGRVLGYHAESMSSTGSLSERLVGQWAAGLHLLLLLLANTGSLALVGLVLAPWRFFRQRDRERPAAPLLWCVLLAIMVVVPLIAPAHVGGLCWGPRYYLSFVPLFFLTAVWPCGNERGWPRTVVAALCVGATLWGAHSNLTYGTAWLSYHQQERTWPMLEFVRQQPETFVVVNEQFTVQELASLVGEKAFFWVEEEGVIDTVARTLHDRGAPGFLIVLALWAPEQQAAALAGGGASIQIASVPTHVHMLGLIGYFAVYRVAFDR